MSGSLQLLEYSAISESKQRKGLKQVPGLYFCNYSYLRVFHIVSLISSDNTQCRPKWNDQLIVYSSRMLARNGVNATWNNEPESQPGGCDL